MQSINIPKISAAELKKRLDAKDDVLLLDVREVQELTAELGHLSGITNIPVSQLVQRVSEIESWKNKPIISICRMGGRAETAAILLKAQGFKDVQILEGGMTAYRHMERFPNT